MDRTLTAPCSVLLSTIIIFLVQLSSSASAQTCSSYKFSSNTIYSSCMDLPHLTSFLHWNFNQSTYEAEVAFRMTGVTSSQWVAWAINPSGSTMIGSQALVAYIDSTGSVYAYTSHIDSYQTYMPEAALSFDVPTIAGSFQDGEMTIFAKLKLSADIVTVSQLWQVGPVSNGRPGTHPIGGDNVMAKGTLNFAWAPSKTPSNNNSSSNNNNDNGNDNGSNGDNNTNGGSTTTSSSDPYIARLRKKNVHGVVNAVSWGTMMPVGAIIARYLRVFKFADPAWFYLHVTSQTSAYIVGVAGWATGLQLGNRGADTGYHGSIGIVLFTGATLQAFALLLRPKKEHKYRLYWNIYHHSIGYATIILSIVNVFKGLEILDPSRVWKRVYVLILIVLGAVALALEAITWLIVIRRRGWPSSQKNHPHISNNRNRVG